MQVSHLAESGIRSKTGCSVVAVVSSGKTEFELDPNAPLSAGTEIILIGSIADENRFLDIYGSS